LTERHANVKHISTNWLLVKNVVDAKKQKNNALPKRRDFNVNKNDNDVWRNSIEQSNNDVSDWKRCVHCRLAHHHHEIKATTTR
jgi:hypothetical protein